MKFDGYHFECACGERFNNAVSATHCSKCRVYAPDSQRTATDLRTGQEVPCGCRYCAPATGCPEEAALIKAATDAIMADSFPQY